MAPETWRPALGEWPPREYVVLVSGTMNPPHRAHVRIGLEAMSLGINKLERRGHKALARSAAWLGRPKPAMPPPEHVALKLVQPDRNRRRVHPPLLPDHRPRPAQPLLLVFPAAVKRHTGQPRVHSTTGILAVRQPEIQVVFSDQLRRPAARPPAHVASPGLPAIDTLLGPSAALGLDPAREPGPKVHVQYQVPGLPAVGLTHECHCLNYRPRLLGVYKPAQQQSLEPFDAEEVDCQPAGAVVKDWAQLRAQKPLEGLRRHRQRDEQAVLLSLPHCEPAGPTRPRHQREQHTRTQARPGIVPAVPPRLCRFFCAKVLVRNSERNKYGVRLMGADASCCDHRYAGPLEWEGPVPDEQAPDPGGIEYPSFNLPCSVPVPPREPTARGPLSGLSSSRWLVRRIPLASWLARLLRMADLEDARGCLLAWRGHCAIGLAAGVAPGSGGPAIVFHTPRSLRPPQLSVADLEPQRVADSRRGALVDSTNKPHGTPASPCLPGRKRLEAVYDMLEANGGRISHADLYQLSKVNASADSARVTAAVTSLVLKGGLIGRDDFARFFAKAVLPADPVESLSCIERLEEAARRKSSAKLRWGSLASLRTSPGGRPTPESSRRLQSLVDSSHLHSALDKRMEMSDMTDSLPEELRPPVSPECAMRPDASLDLDEWELALQRVQPGGVLEDDLLLVDAGKLAEHEVSMTPSPRGYEYDKTILSIY